MTQAQTAARKKTRRATRPLRIVFLLTLAMIALITVAYFGNRFFEKRTYRLLYPEEIVTYSLEYQLNPQLTAAVIQVESANRSQVVSPKGAVGLMQIMPATGAWIAENMGMDDYREDRLTDPAVNIQMGCWYLRYLLDMFENENTAVAAYNAGPGKVKQWLADERYASDGALCSIPYEETERYVKKVAAAKEKYAELYEKELSRQ